MSRFPAITTWSRFSLAFALLVAAVPGTVALFGTLQAAPKVQAAVEARRFVLRDARGQQRGPPEIGSNETAFLTLSDTTGRARAIVGASDDGASVALMDGAGRPRFWVSAQPEPVLLLYDRACETRASFRLGAERDQPVLELGDDKKNPRLRVQIGPDGAPAVELRDETGATRATVTLRGDGTPGVFLADRGGTTRAAFSVMPAPSESSYVHLADQQGRPRLALAAQAGGGAVLVYDEAGKARGGLAQSGADVVLVMADAEGNSLFEAPPKPAPKPAKPTRRR
jgi:hypothetical protein